MGLDVLSGHDRRPVSMAYWRQDGQVLALPFGLSDGGAQDYHYYQQLSYYLFLLHPSKNTHKQDRQRHSHGQYLRHGELLGQGRRGHGTAHFFFSFGSSAGGRHTSHIIPVFFGGGGAPMKIPLIISHQYQGSSSAVVHPLPEQQLTSGPSTRPRQRTSALSAYSQPWGFFHGHSRDWGLGSVMSTKASAFCHAFVAFFFYLLSPHLLRVLIL